MLDFVDFPWDKPWCYYVDPTQNPKEHDGYVPSVVFENVPGHYPMLRTQGQAPWVFGATLEQAEIICRRVNAQRGLSERDVTKIVASSMRGRARR